MHICQRMTYEQTSDNFIARFVYVKRKIRHVFTRRLVGWLVVFNIPLTARSFRDGTPIYCPLRRT